MIRFDVAYMFERLGGPKGMHDALKAAFPRDRLQYATVQMWQQRGNISQPWQAPVLYVLKQRAKIDPMTCMIDDDDGFAV